MSKNFAGVENFDGRGYIPGMGKEIRIRELTPEEKRIAIELAAKGMGIGDIQRELMLDAPSFYWMREHDIVFKDDFERARAEGLEQLADDLITIPDTYADVQRAKVKSDNIRWLLSKRKPKVYGDKLDIEVTEKLDLTAALQEARQRRSMQSVRQVVEVKKLLTPNDDEG